MTAQSAVSGPEMRVNRGDAREVLGLRLFQRAGQIGSRVVLGASSGDGITEHLSSQGTRAMGGFHDAALFQLAQGCQQGRRGLVGHPQIADARQVFFGQSTLPLDRSSAQTFLRPLR